MLKRTLVAILVSTSPAFADDVVCENPNDCPGWIGMLNDTQGGQCSSFLVKKDILGTNLHCIPDHLQKEKASCDQLIVTFPKTSTLGREQVSCSEIIHISPVKAENFLRQDFAFIRLSKPVERPVLEISQNGFPDNTNVTIFKVDPGQTSTVRKINCKTIQKSVINPYYTSDLSQLILLADCPVIPGNSGSPILRDDKVTGIVAARHENLAPASVQGQVNQERLVSSSGTNFNCLSTHFLGYNRGYDDECKIDLTNNNREKIVVELYQGVENKALERAQNAMVPKVEKITYKKTVPFQLELKARIVQHPNSIIRRSLVEPIPKCLFPRGLPADLTDEKVEFEFPVTELDLKFDKYFRFTTDSRELTAKVSFRIHDGKIPQDRFIAIKWTNPPGVTPSEETFSIKRCSGN